MKSGSAKVFTGAMDDMSVEEIDGFSSRASKLKQDRRTPKGGSGVSKEGAGGKSKKQEEEDARARARRRWKKAGNLAIAVNRFERSAKEGKKKDKEREREGGRERENRDKQSRSNTPTNSGSSGSRSVTPKSKPAELPKKITMKNTTVTRVKVTPKHAKGQPSHPLAGGGEKKRFGTKKENDKCKAVRQIMAAKPGPRIENGTFSGRGVHTVRWKEKLRGLSLVTHNIVLGGRDEANNKDMMDRYGITHVLNSCKQLKNFFPDDYTYLKINAMDDPKYDIRKDFEKASEFIARVEKLKGRVLVHCIAGVSRSVCFVLMHLMRHHEVCLNQGYKHIKNVRPFIHPNEGFLYQMAMFEVDTFGFTSVAGTKAGKDWAFYKWNSEKCNFPRGGEQGALIRGGALCNIL